MTETVAIETLAKGIEEMDRRVRQDEDRDAIHRLLVDLQTAMEDRDLVRYASFFIEDW